MLSSRRTMPVTMRSTRSASTGRLRSACWTARSNFSRSKGSRRPAFAKFRGAEPPRRAGRRAQADTRCDRGLLGIERDRVFVAGDVGAIESFFRGTAGDLLGTEVAQHQMRVGPAGDDVEAGRLQGLGQDFRVVDDGTGVALE